MGSPAPIALDARPRGHAPAPTPPAPHRLEGDPLDALLGREPVRLDPKALGGFLRDRTVLVTGAAGSIGRELCRQVLAAGPECLVAFDLGENGLFQLERDLAPLAGGIPLVARIGSVADPGRVRAVLREHRPAVVLHAAAHKHVPMMEANPGEAVKNNVLGTRTLVDASIRAGADAFVLISTDKAVRPTSVMGACKRAAELYVRSVAGRSALRVATVRFGNVLGSSGSVVPIFRDQIRAGGPVTVTHPEMRRFFMTISEAAQLVLRAGAMGRGGETFVLDMGEPIRIADLARAMIRRAGLVEGRDIALTFTGLRPGEKLSEDLFGASEERAATAHPRIGVALGRDVDPARLRAGFARLTRVVDGSAAEIKAALRSLVPDYRPGPSDLHVAPVEGPAAWDLAPAVATG